MQTSIDTSSIPDFIKNSPGIWSVIFDADGRVYYANAAYEKQVKNVLDETFFGHFPKDEREKLIDTLSDIGNNNSLHIALSLRHFIKGNNQLAWSRWEITCFSHDELQLFIAIGHTSQSPEATNTIFATENRYKREEQTILDSILTIDNNLIIKDFFINNGFGDESLKEQLIGKPLHTFVNEEILLSITPKVTAAFQFKQGGVVEFGIAEQGHMKTFFECRIIPMSSEDTILAFRDVTERKNLSSKLEKSDRLYEDLIHNISAGVYILSESGQFRFVSPKWCEITGYRQEDILKGKVDIFSNIHEEDAERVKSENDQAIQLKRTFEMEFRLWVKGKLRYAKVSSIPYRNTDGTWEWHGVHHDITEIKAAEQALADRDRVLRKLSKQLLGVIYQFQVDPLGNYSFPFASGPIEEIMGLTEEQIEEDFTRIFELIHEEDRAAHQASIEKSYHELSFWDHTFRVIHHKTGQTIWVNGRSAPEKMPDGSVIWYGYFTDISKEMESEERLRFQAALLQNVGQAVIVTDLQGKVTFWNNFATDLYGWTAEEAEGEMLYQLMDFPQSKEEDMVFMLELLKAGKKLVNEYQIKTKTGKVFYAKVEKNPFFGSDGALKNIISVSSDITKEKEQSDELKKQKDFNQWLVEMHQLFLTTPKANYRSFFDKILLHLLSFTNSEYGFIGEVKLSAQGEPYLKTFAISNISWDEQSRSFYESNAPTGMEFHNLDTLFGHVMKHREIVIANDPANDSRAFKKMPHGHPDLNTFLGLPFLVEDKLVGMCGLANRPGGYSLEIADFLKPFTISISTLIESIRLELEKQAAEKELNDALKLLNTQNERLREFTYITSHNIRSHASNFKGLVEIAWPEQNLDVRNQYLRLMDDAAAKLLVTLDHLNDLFTVQQNIDIDKETINVFEVIQNIISSLQYDILHSNSEILLDFDQNFEIEFNLAYIESILLNLLSNAIKYRSLDKTPVIRVTCGEEGASKFIEIADNGLGIDLNVHGEKLFGMYQTFHRNKDARGLGLFITRHQIESLGGKISVKSEVNKGTTFKLSFA